MAANPVVLVSEEEYLTTAYESDVDFADGVLEGRNVGEFEHARVQFKIGVFLDACRDLIVLTEQRIKVAPRRYRIADTCAVRAGGPISPILTSPPLVVVEVKSPADRLGRVLKRLDDFVSFGVPHIWFLDPQERAAFTYSAEGLKLATTLAMPEVNLSIDVEELFRAAFGEPPADVPQNRG